jgi:hypothetical protein
MSWPPCPYLISNRKKGKSNERSTYQSRTETSRRRETSASRFVTPVRLKVDFKLSLDRAKSARSHEALGEEMEEEVG